MEKIKEIENDNLILGFLSTQYTLFSVVNHIGSLHSGMYVCICACMYICMYICMYVYMHVCIYVCIYVCVFAFQNSTS